MPPRIDRQRFLALLNQGLSYAEIAEELGIKMDAVQKRVYRLRKQGIEVPDRRLGGRQAVGKPEGKLTVRQAESKPEGKLISKPIGKPEQALVPTEIMPVLMEIASWWQARQQAGQQVVRQAESKLPASRRKMTYNLSEELIHQVRQYAQAHGMTSNQVVEQAPLEFLATGEGGSPR